MKPLVYALASCALVAFAYAAGRARERDAHIAWLLLAVVALALVTATVVD